VPLTASGQLAIVASADLGALGSKDGPRISYNWVLPNVAPLLLPWLALAILLTLKRNRCAQAWWILLPVGCVAALSMAPPDIIPGDMDFLLDVVAALGVGLAAVWLLANYLRRKHRLLTFLCVVLTMAAFSGLAYASRLDLSSPNEMKPAAFALAMGVVLSAVALGIMGLICRKRYRPAGIYVWMVALLAVLWTLCAAPFYLYDVLGSSQRIDLSEFFTPVLTVALCHFAVMLPFLILSSASPFYRERLKALLHVKEELAGVKPPVPEASLKA
jgi:multisubunit Na+/H+ antiporter MnhE subunit